MAPFCAAVNGLATPVTLTATLILIATLLTIWVEFRWNERFPADNTAFHDNVNTPFGALLLGGSSPRSLESCPEAPVIVSYPAFPVYPTIPPRSPPIEPDS